MSAGGNTRDPWPDSPDPSAGGENLPVATQHGNISDIFPRWMIRNRYRYIIRDLAGGTGRLLVVGAGEGTFERMLRERNPRLHITSLEMDGTFRASLEAVSERVIIDDFISGAGDLGEPFDHIAAVDVIEHVWDTDAFLRKLKALLAPEGRAYLKAPNLASWHGRITLLLGYSPEAVEVSYEKGYFGRCWPFRHPYPIHHVRSFTTRALKEMVRYHGFAIDWAIGVDDRLPALFRRLPGIAGSVCLKLRHDETP